MMRKWFVLFGCILLIFCATPGCATRSSVDLEHATVTNADGTSSDTIRFKPLAKVGIGGDIAEAKQDMALKMVSPDGTVYELASGQNAQGLSNKAQVEMMSAMFQGLFNALPGMVDAAIGGYIGAAQIDIQRPPGTSWQETLIQQLGQRSTISVTPITPTQ